MQWPTFWHCTGSYPLSTQGTSKHEWMRLQKKTNTNCIVVPDNWWNSGYIHVLWDECEYSYNPGQYSSLLDKYSYLIRTMGTQRYIPKPWQGVGSISCNWGDPSCMPWVLDLPFSPELMFHVEAAICGSPGTCFSEIRTTCEIFGTPIRPSTVERYGSQEY